MLDVDSSELSSPPEFALGWRKPPRSSSCPLPQATQYPHPMTDWCRGIKAWPPCLNSGQLWKAFPVLELPILPVEAFVVTATQSNFSFSPVLLPSLPLGIKPLAHKSPSQSLFPEDSDKEQSLVPIWLCPWPLCILPSPLCILWNSKCLLEFLINQQKSWYEGLRQTIFFQFPGC